jgi:uncharacterized protein (TIGR02391 family)
MEDLQDFLSKAKALKSEHYDSPKIDLFKTRLKDFLNKNYPAEYAAIVDAYFWVGVVFEDSDFQQEYEEAMQKTIGFLEDLIESNDAPKDAQPKFTVMDELSGLHPKILAKSQKLFKDGHYREAVGNAFMVVKDRLRAITGYESAYPAFEDGGLYINGAAAPEVDDAFQDGVKRLLGSIDKFRNEKFHTAEGGISDKNKALSYLHICNLALTFLETDQYSIRRNKTK